MENTNLKKDLGGEKTNLEKSAPELIQPQILVPLSVDGSKHFLIKSGDG